jgi:3-phosphoshikimate 1-carboxyvinyltransferase
MNAFGITVHREGYQNYKIPGNQIYRKGTYTVEADASQAGYFFAVAAVTKSKITVKGIAKHSKQGDIRLLKLLENMGCNVEYLSDGICVQGGTLSAIEADMADMPDMVPTLAVVAAFAEGTTHIKNVMHLKLKESDRLAAVISELTKMGIKARSTDTGISITGETPCGAVIDTYDDHRIAMSFALAGLVVPNIIVKNEGCVAKSFPNYWKVLKEL